MVGENTTAVATSESAGVASPSAMPPSPSPTLLLCSQDVSEESQQCNIVQNFRKQEKHAVSREARGQSLQLKGKKGDEVTLCPELGSHQPKCGKPEFHSVGCTPEKIQYLLDQYERIRHSGHAPIGCTYGIDTFVIGDFDEKGGFLCLRKFSACMVIPRGALKGRQTMYLCVLPDGSRDGIRASYSLVYKCGPSDVALDLPVQLHITDSSTDKKSFRCPQVMERKKGSTEWRASEETIADWGNETATLEILCLSSHFQLAHHFADAGARKPKFIHVCAFFGSNRATFYVMNRELLTTVKELESRKSNHSWDFLIYYFHWRYGPLIITDTNDRHNRAVFDVDSVMVSTCMSADLELERYVNGTIFAVTQESGETRIQFCIPPGDVSSYQFQHQVHRADPNRLQLQRNAQETTKTPAAVQARVARRAMGGNDFFVDQDARQLNMKLIHLFVGKRVAKFFAMDEAMTTEEVECELRQGRVYQESFVHWISFAHGPLLISDPDSLTNQVEWTVEALLKSRMLVAHLLYPRGEIFKVRQEHGGSIVPVVVLSKRGDEKQRRDRIKVMMSHMSTETTKTPAAVQARVATRAMGGNDFFVDQGLRAIFIIVGIVIAAFGYWTMVRQ